MDGRETEHETTVNISLEKAAAPRPEGMAYFDELAAGVGHRRSIEAARAAGLKVAGTYCGLVPSELLDAMGFLQVRLCTETFEEQSETTKVPAACHVVEQSLGRLLAEEGETARLLDVIIIPTTCGWKSALDVHLEPHVQVHVLNVPQERTTAGAAEKWRRQIRRMIDVLEGISLKRLSRSALVSSATLLLECVGAARRLMREDHDRRALRGSDRMLVSSVFHLDLPENWLAAVTALLSELRRGSAANGGQHDGPGVLLLGSPVYDPAWEFPRAVEEAGGWIVADDVCSCSSVLHDPPVLDEPTVADMVDAASDRALLCSRCPCFTPNTNRLGWIHSAVADFGVDGVIYHVVPGCHVQQMESINVQRLLSGLRVPVLVLEVDYARGGVEETKPKLRAFVEMLRLRSRTERKAR